MMMMCHGAGACLCVRQHSRWGITHGRGTVLREQNTWQLSIRAHGLSGVTRVNVTWGGN